MADIDKVVESFGCLNGLTKDVFEDSVGNMCVSMVTANKNSGVVYMFNSKGDFIAMSTIGEIDFKSEEDYKKSCGAI